MVVGRKRPRRGIGLALSGGGYRATLFHIGALRRLFELGVLQRADFRTISSVSGGSITAAGFATALAGLGRLPATLDEWKQKVETPLRTLTKSDIRTGIVARKFLLPWHWTDGDYAVESFAERLQKRLTPLMLRDLPASPSFAICATDLSFGANFIFTRNRMGSYLAGHMTPPADFPLARAVAASACFPPVFDPLPLGALARELKGGAAPQLERDASVEDIRLSDGGVYDNFGLEPIWKSHAVVLVSDAGGLFKGESDKSLLWRVKRYQAVQEEQTRRLRRRSLRIGFKKASMAGASWSVGSVRRWPEGDAASRDIGGYSRAFAVDVLAEIRTDLDAFSDLEAGVLMNHAYLSAAAAIARNVPQLCAENPPPLSPPAPDFLPPRVSEEELRRQLAGSSERHYKGRG